jgi:hypothetical protein
MAYAEQAQGGTRRAALLGMTGALGVSGGVLLAACGQESATQRPGAAALAGASLTFLERGGPPYAELHKARAEAFMALARGRRGGAGRQEGRPAQRAQGAEPLQGPPAGCPVRATVRAPV